MINIGWQNSSVKYYLYQRLNNLNLEETPEKLSVLKNEEFALQLLMWSDKDTYYALDHDRISFKGIHHESYRIQCSSWKNIETGNIINQCPNLRFVDYVNDDEGRMVSDPIITDRGIERNAGCFQGIWIDGCFDKDLEAGNYMSEIKVFRQNAYEDEVVIKCFEIKIEVLDKILKPLAESDFFLDLWQHPSNWARKYKVKMWSDEHFDIIKNYLSSMSRLGQKVVTIICSDYPWAGQKCYEITKNPSNLFEHNMSQIERTENGSFEYDFSFIGKYIEIAKSVGIDKEIDLFGLLGNWDRWSFGKPVENYGDPIRIKYRNQVDGTYSYMSDVEEVKDYIKSLFEYLYELGVWNQVRIMCDEPDSPEGFEEYLVFLKELAPGELKIKSAIHVPKMMPLSSKMMNDVSLGLNILGEAKGNVEKLHDEFQVKEGILTWYICCFPSRPNNFISSPRLESRMIGWLTHYFKLDGFLRWDFAIWPENPYEDASYKYPKWTAGDMFFVYPGANMKPVSSQRLENLLYGLQDFQILDKYLKTLDENSEKDYFVELEKILGNKANIENNDLEVSMDYSLDYSQYVQFRNNILKLY